MARLRSYQAFEPPQPRLVPEVRRASGRRRGSADFGPPCLLNRGVFCSDSVNCAEAPFAEAVFGVAPLEVQGELIELNVLLKLLGLAPSGGAAKALIAAGQAPGRTNRWNVSSGQCQRYSE